MEYQKFRALDLRSSYTSVAYARGLSYFVGIGINRYKNYQHLNNAVKDVEDVSKLLKQSYDVDYAYLCLDAKATRGGIISLLDNLRKELTEQDKLLIYFSGHGYIDKDNLGYWIPYDAERSSNVNHIRNSTLQDYIRVLPSKHILLISDACFSGSIFFRGESRSAIVNQKLEHYKSRWAFCSGRQDEKVHDGIPGTNSPFAASILSVLQHNQNEGLNISELAHFVQQQTGANYDQLPEANPINGVGHAGGQYIFRLKGYKHDEQASKIIKTSITETKAPNVVDILDLKFVLVPAGKSPFGKETGTSFYIAETPLSCQQWDKLMEAEVPSVDNHLAKVNISVEDVLALISKVNQIIEPGFQIAIPSLAQLQYCIDFTKTNINDLIIPALKRGPASEHNLFDLTAVVFQMCNSGNFYQAIGGSYWISGQSLDLSSVPTMNLSTTFTRDPLVGFRPILIR